MAGVLQLWNSCASSVKCDGRWNYPYFSSPPLPIPFHMHHKHLKLVTDSLSSFQNEVQHYRLYKKRDRILLKQKQSCPVNSAYSVPKWTCAQSWCASSSSLPSSAGTQLKVPMTVAWGSCCSQRGPYQTERVAAVVRAMMQEPVQCRVEMGVFNIIGGRRRRPQAENTDSVRFSQATVTISLKKKKQTTKQETFACCWMQVA